MTAIPDWLFQPYDPSMEKSFRWSLILGNHADMKWVKQVVWGHNEKGNGIPSRARDIRQPCYGCGNKPYDMFEFPSPGSGGVYERCATCIKKLHDYLGNNDSICPKCSFPATSWSSIGGRHTAYCKWGHEWRWE